MTGTITSGEVVSRLLALPAAIERAELALLRGENERVDAQAAVTAAEDVLLLDGETINGKNAEVRAAQTRERTKGERLLLTAREQLQALQRLELKRLQNEFSALKAVARLLGGEA